MGEFRSYLISFLIVGLFFIAMVSFAVNFATENNTPSQLLDNDLINDSYVDMQNQIGTSTEETSQEQINSSILEAGETGGESILLFSVWGSIKQFYGSITGVSKIILRLPQALGINGLIISILLGIVGMSIIFLGWKLIRSGE